MLADVANTKKQFFVRVKGDASSVAEVEKVFGKVELVQAGLEGEFGFITEEMSEAVYEECAAKMDTILNRIRVRAK
jgi:homoserine dehydrogenase